jgi:hypothetical protein
MWTYLDLPELSLSAGPKDRCPLTHSRVYWANLPVATIALLESLHREKPDLSSGFNVSSYFPKAADIWQYWFSCSSRIGSWKRPVHIRQNTHCFPGRNAPEALCVKLETVYFSCWGVDITFSTLLSWYSRYLAHRSTSMCVTHRFEVVHVLLSTSKCTHSWVDLAMSLQYGGTPYYM